MDEWPGRQKSPNQTKKKEKKIKNENSLKEFWDNFKHNSVCIIVVPESEERERCRKLTWRNNGWKFPLRGEGNRHSGPGSTESHKKISPKKSTLRYIIIKMAKVKNQERILKAAREKQIDTCKGNLIKLFVDVLAETLQARRKWQIYLKCWTGKKLITRNTLSWEVISGLKER